MEDLPVLFNPIDHAETYSNSPNVLPMENALFFNPYFHVEAADSFVYLNPTTHPQMLGHTTPPTSYGLVQANNHTILSNPSNLVAPAQARNKDPQLVGTSSQSMCA
jgi:hypothetical protein